VSRVFIVLLFTFFSLHAVEWKTYEEALKLQKKTSKIIMIDAMRSNCHFCIDMCREVFRDKNMSKWLEDRFILVKLNLDTDEVPLDIKVHMTPTFFFVDKNQKIVKKIPGAWNIEDFKSLTQKIKGD